MGGHECVPPAVSGGSRSSWRCPSCGQRWKFNPNGGALSDLWHGRANSRLPDGKTKPRGWFS